MYEYVSLFMLVILKKLQYNKLYLKKIGIVCVLLLIVGFSCAVPQQETDQQKEEGLISEKSETLILYNLEEGQSISSPLVLLGEAKGTWFFEGSFPVTLTDWDGKIVAEGYAMSLDEWMTEEYVPFSSTVYFDSPYIHGDPEFMRRGTVILQKENPAGMPQYNDVVEVPVYYSVPE